MAKTKQLSIRMPLDLAERLTARESVAKYVVEAVREKIYRDDQREIEASLQCLANDPEANDISDFTEAQRQVFNRGD